VQKTAGSTTLDYVYDISGNVVSEVTPTSVNADYIYVDGQRVAEYRNNTTYFIFSDHLGSTRLVTALDGSTYDSMDYVPFGEQIAGDTSTTHKFTGKERDSESGLDNFGARYLSSQYGRFMSPDPANTKGDVEDFTDPQGWNMYSYVRNNPLSLTDPDGQSYQVCVTVQDPDNPDKSKQQCTTVSDEQFSNLQRDPGAGISLRNGDIYATDANGNQVKAGTYNQTDVDLPPGVADMLGQAGRMSDAGVKAAMVLTAPEYLAAAGGAAAVELAGEGISLSIFQETQTVVKEHALRHLASDALKAEAKAAIQQAINSGQVRYISGGTFIGRVIMQGQQYVFTGAFQNGVAQIGRITEGIRDSLGRFLP
jgi:RHS repeat-associated protein